MIAFVYPAFLWAGAGIALGIVALHFLAPQRPDSELLPTVRFFPEAPIRATVVRLQLSDRALLLLRVAIVLMIAIACAQPYVRPRRRAVARIVAIDLSRDVTNPGEVIDSARRYSRGAAAVIVLDATARELPLAHVDDSVAVRARSRRGSGRGTLSSALIASFRAASRVRDGADSLDLTVISPFLKDEQDEATLAIRSLWPGRIRLVRLAAVDSAATLREAAARPRIEWADSTVTGFWAARAHPDTVGAVRTGDIVLVYPFVRRWVAAVPMDSLTHVWARWVDGEPAAFERMTPTGCVRSLGMAMPAAGDAILRPEFVRFAEGLEAPCGEARQRASIPPAVLTTLEGPASLASAAAVSRRRTRVTPAVLWWLVAAFGLSWIELIVRARTTSAGRE